jgi:AraC-like DNA-binding protein
VPACAVLVERRPALLALRRALARSDQRIFAARSPARLSGILARHLCDVVILGREAAHGPVLDAFRREFPALPLLIFAPFRSDDGELLLHLYRLRGTALAVESVDEPVLLRLVSGHSLTARRMAELAPLAEPLDLIDSFQRRAWRLVVKQAPFGLSTAALARQLKVRRETLSRRFAAGMAPPLKRAIDAVRLVAAAQLLGNPGYQVADAARLLGFSSVSLLQQTARRTFGVSARRVASLDADRIVGRLGSRP